jgi:predicted nucleotidyltransferase
MTDSPDYDPALLAWVTPVVTALANVLPTEQLMLVGAQCRDLLHWRYCRGVPPRATNDTDIAVALNNWYHFEAIRATFPTLGNTGHRFLIADRAVDVIPFGGVESRTGTSRHPPGNERMNVHGFTDAYLRADVLSLPGGGLTVRIPQPPNYAVLKLHAWLDRSADHDYKDGPDLALAVHWYAGDLDRLYAEPHQWALRRHDFDLRTAGAALLGHDMCASVSPPQAAVLATRVTEADYDLLAEHFAVGQPGWPATEAARRPLVDALLEDLLTFPWVWFHAARPGSAGHRPPRVSMAMPMSASGL